MKSKVSHIPLLYIKSVSASQIRLTPQRLPRIENFTILICKVFFFF